MSRFVVLCVCAVALTMSSVKAHQTTLCSATNPTRPASTTFYFGTYHGYNPTSVDGAAFVIPPSGIKKSFPFTNGAAMTAESKTPGVPEQAHKDLWCKSIGCGGSSSDKKSCTGTASGCSSYDPSQTIVSCYIDWRTGAPSAGDGIHWLQPAKVGQRSGCHSTSGVKATYFADMPGAGSGQYIVSLTTTQQDLMYEAYSPTWASGNSPDLGNAACAMGAPDPKNKRPGSGNKFEVRIGLSVASGGVAATKGPDAVPQLTIPKDCSVKSNWFSGFVCQAQCASGYHMIGTLMVQKDGSWSTVSCTNKPVCKTSALPAGIVGIVGTGCGTLSMSGTKCGFNCETGKLGTGILECTASGWSTAGVTTRPNVCMPLSSFPASAVGAPAVAGFGYSGNGATGGDGTKLTFSWGAGAGGSDPPVTQGWSIVVIDMATGKAAVGVSCPSVNTPLPPAGGVTCTGAKSGAQYSIQIKSSNAAGDGPVFKVDGVSTAGSSSAASAATAPPPTAIDEPHPQVSYPVFAGGPAPNSAISSVSYLANLQSGVRDSGLSCQTGYMGATCSERVCSYGLSSNSNNAGANDENFIPGSGAHSYSECSGQGLCDRATGNCNCFPGYEGKGCRRGSCPNDCSGKGRCLPNHAVNSAYQSTGNSEFDNKFWDYSKSMQCVCDRGYTGDDCSKRICPNGDDVLTKCGDSGSNDIQTLKLVSSPTSFVLTFEDNFGGRYNTESIKNAGTATAGAIQEALESLPNNAIPSIQVRALSTSTFALTFSDTATPGKQNLVGCEILQDVCNAGNQPKYPGSKGSCTTAHDPSVTKYEENVPCGNRGVCDDSSGLCTCFSGHSGEACQEQSTFV